MKWFNKARTAIRYRWHRKAIRKSHKRVQEALLAASHASLQDDVELMLLASIVAHDESIVSLTFLRSLTYDEEERAHLTMITKRQMITREQHVECLAQVRDQQKQEAKLN